VQLWQRRDLLCRFAHHPIGRVAKRRVRVTAEVQRGTDRVGPALQLALKVGRATLRDLQHHSERLQLDLVCMQTRGFGRGAMCGFALAIECSS
jgi:hypothetical protein